MTTRLLALLASVTAPLMVGCFGGGGGDDGGGPNLDPACQLDSVGEKEPGYPYDIATFRSTVLPAAIKGCGSAGCHGSPDPALNKGFQLWADAATNDCNFGKSFNQVAAKIDLNSPAASRLLLAPSDSPTHPKIFADTTGADYVAIKGYIDTASAKYIADNGTVQPPPGDANPFDRTVFERDVNPAFTRAGCTNAGCHAAPGQGGFSLKPNATSAADIDANYSAAIGKSSLVGAPNQARTYFKATNPHGGSTAMAAADAQKLLAWITAAKNVAPDNGNIGCAPIDKFNLGVFTQEILPVLTGDLDYNDPNRQGNGAGCTSSQCHGQSRGPGSLTMLPTDDPAKILASFVCFVDLASPSASEVLECPLDGDCRIPHPGQDVLFGADDLNYQRILAFLFGAKADVSPHDFAFFARKINPIFNDPDATVDGGQVETCSGTGACHGIQVVGQAPPNGSDFGIIPNASEITGLTSNFVSATGFVSFLAPDQSSLFLYPTDEIANRNNPFATGLPHPGGPDFAIDSEEALLILKWAGGLRPDAQGFVRDWLVAGDFPAQLITDRVSINEATVKPKIFDRGGGSFNSGEWDGFFSDAALVDLNIPFERDATAGRVAFASTYVINTDTRDIDAQIIVETNNPVRIYVDGRLAGTNDQGGTTTAIALLKASNKKEGTAHVLIKLLQRANDNDFAFTAQFRDDIGNVLTDETGELVFTLANNGGI